MTDNPVFAFLARVREVGLAENLDTKAAVMQLNELALQARGAPLGNGVTFPDYRAAVDALHHAARAIVNVHREATEACGDALASTPATGDAKADALAAAEIVGMHRRRLEGQLVRPRETADRADNELRMLAGRLGIEADPPTKARGAPRRRRRQSARPLTDKQVLILERMAEEKGDAKKVAADLGISRQTVEEQYKTANMKITKIRGPMGATKKPKQQRMPTDKRGQTAI